MECHSQILIMTVTRKFFWRIGFLEMSSLPLFFGKITVVKN